MSKMKKMAVADLRAIIRDDPTDFIFARQAIQGVRATLPNMDNLSTEGGFIPDIQFSITAPLEDFPSPPKEGMGVDIDNEPYRIMRVNLDAFGAGIQLDLQSAHR